jgi:AcrR family transcriptional regulator
MTARRLSAQALRGESARYERPRTAREAAILRAATRLFGANGYRGARTADIAAAAGVTERTLFKYFASKEALHRRVMFPAVLAATMPCELTETGKLFAADSESFAQWHRRVLKLRIDAARVAAPQLRLLLATLMTEEPVRRKVIAIWRENLWRHALRTVRRFQKRGELRAGLRPEVIARAIISLNLGYIIARALLAPEARWDDDAEIAATVGLLLDGAAQRPETRRSLAASNSVRQ